MAQIPGNVFREYDIRGLVDNEITSAFANLLGKGFGTLAVKAGAKRIAIGYDGRLSSVPLRNALAEGLVSTGLHVTDVGLGPTPMVYFANHELNTDASIMITGSHNPADMNGFKLVLGGLSFYGEQIQALRKVMEAESFVIGEGSEVVDSTLQKRYVDYLLTDFNEFYGACKPLKVVWDVGNGATGNVLCEMVKTLPGTHILMNEVIDGTFPAHHPDPTVPKNLVDLQEAVLSHKADLGIAFDGDGDRIGVVDDCAKILWGDQLLILFAKEVLKKMPNATIIGDVKASQLLFDKVQEMGGTPLMWRTGHSLIKTKMKETKSPLAGEMSGHVFFADRYFGYDDALYAAIRLLGIRAEMDQNISVWRQTLPTIYNTPELRIECETQDKFSVVKDLKEQLRKEGIPFNDVDGVRVLSEDGWWLLRASNTQEILVARIESGSLEGLERLEKTLKHYLRPFDLQLQAA